MPKNCRALSPVVASIILIAVTVLASVVAAFWLGSSNIQITQTTQKQETLNTLQYLQYHAPNANVVNATVHPYELTPDGFFYWLFTSNTIQIKDSTEFVTLADNLNTTTIYYHTDKNWNSEFGFIISDGTYYGLNDINVIYWVNGTTWTFGGN